MRRYVEFEISVRMFRNLLKTFRKVFLICAHLLKRFGKILKTFANPLKTFRGNAMDFRISPGRPMQARLTTHHKHWGD